MTSNSHATHLPSLWWESFGVSLMDVAELHHKLILCHGGQGSEWRLLQSPMGPNWFDWRPEVLKRSLNWQPVQNNNVVKDAGHIRLWFAGRLFWLLSTACCSFGLSACSLPSTSTSSLGLVCLLEPHYILHIEMLASFMYLTVWIRWFLWKLLKFYSTVDTCTKKVPIFHKDLNEYYFLIQQVVVCYWENSQTVGSLRNQLAWFSQLSVFKKRREWKIYRENLEKNENQLQQTIHIFARLNKGMLFHSVL